MCHLLTGKDSWPAILQMGGGRRARQKDRHRSDGPAAHSPSFLPWILPWLRTPARPCLLWPKPPPCQTPRVPPHSALTLGLHGTVLFPRCPGPIIPTFTSRPSTFFPSLGPPSPVPLVCPRCHLGQSKLLVCLHLLKAADVYHAREAGGINLPASGGKEVRGGWPNLW